MKRFPLFGKIATIAMLILVLTVALFFVRDIIEERSHYRAQSEEEVMASHGGAQRLTGPFIYVPYTETYTRKVTEDVEGQEGKKASRQEKVVSEGGVYLFPSKLDIQSKIETQTRYRGIFPVTVYQSEHTIDGHYNKLEIPAIAASQAGGVVQVQDPILVLEVANIRGITNPVLTWGTKSLRLTQLSQITNNKPAGMKGDALGVVLDATILDKVASRATTIGTVDNEKGKGIDFRLSTGLAGSSAFSWVPLADENHIQVSSAWPHPKFEGAFLPSKRSVSDKGFTAEWSVSSLASKAQSQMLGQTSSEGVSAESVEVSLMNPVDSYAQSERATKYAMLFILLTFASFFTFEMVKQLRLHPMQYLFVGAAMVVFFLLMVSLSEHMEFAIAYLIASLACIGLITTYMQAVLGGWRRGLGVAALLSTMYGVLYAILSSEDSALMMGSILVFAVLAILMMVTRKMDWYALGTSPSNTANTVNAIS